MPRNSKNCIIKLNIPGDIPLELKEKFPELKKLTNKEILKVIIEDYLGDLSVFEPQYYNEVDIKELFYEKKIN